VEQVSNVRGLQRLLCLPGQRVSKTVEMDTPAKFIKIRVENLDGSQSVSDVKITATLGS
jgi:hypothetical protein